MISKYETSTSNSKTILSGHKTLKVSQNITKYAPDEISNWPKIELVGPINESKNNYYAIKWGLTDYQMISQIRSD